MASASPALTAKRLRQAQTELSARDAKMATAIERVGDCTLLPRREGTHFGHLARNIVYQQLSGSAAATIHGRFLVALGEDHPTPAAVLAAPEETLRSCGLSTAKVRAVRDLAAHVHDGRLPLDQIQDERPRHRPLDRPDVSDVPPWQTGCVTGS
jgi:DNA-3-methyladenine glycosylase II